MTGIYKITCNQNNKVYIGQSTSIKRRWAQHKLELKKGIHSNRYLQRVYDKYGEESFVYEILELCSSDKLNEREKFYIKLFNSFEEGFNLDHGGSDISGELNPMYGKKGIESPRFIDYIYQLDLNGNIVNTFESSNLAAKAVGGQTSHILGCLKGWKQCSPSWMSDRERFTHKKSYWIYKKDYELLKEYGYDFSQKRNRKSITISQILDEGALDGDI